MTTKRKTAKKTVKAATKSATTAGKTLKEATGNISGSIESFAHSAQVQITKMLNDININAENIRENTSDISDFVRERGHTTHTFLQETGTELATAARDEFSDAVQYATNMIQVRSFGDALEIQHDYWTNLFEKRLERTRTIAEARTAFSCETVEIVSSKVEDNIRNSAITDFSFEKLMPYTLKV